MIINKFKNINIFDLENSGSGDLVFDSKFKDVFSLKDKELNILDFKGFTAYPGLINSHDHLPGNWYRKIGETPYKNTYDWLDTYRNLKEHDEKAKVWVLGVKNENYETNMHSLKMIGVYKNIISGVTTVLDHLPRQKDSYYYNNGIRIFKNFYQTHSPKLLNIWGGDSLEKELELAGDKYPFVTHLAEGVDEEAKLEFDKFKKMGGVRKNLVIIHGVALTKKNIDDIAEIGASIVWCPDSNVYLLNAIFNVKYAIEKGVNIAIGTDSTMTGSRNLFDELRFAQKFFHQFNGETLPKIEIFKQATINGAKLLGLQNETGKIEKGYSADFFIVKDDGTDPLERLFTLNPKDIVLSFAQGKPVYGDVEFIELFQKSNQTFSKLKINGKEKLLFGNLEKDLTVVNNVIGKKCDWPFLFLNSTSR